MDLFAKKLIANGQTTISNYLLANYPKIGMTSSELVMFLQIKRYSDEGIKFPNIKEITNSTGYSKATAYEILHKMIQQKLLRIDTVRDRNHDSSDCYDLSLVYQKLALLSQSHRDNNENWRFNSLDRSNVNHGITAASRTGIFKLIQEEFGRQLSEMEISTVSHWLEIDHYSPQMISMALKEAVLSQVFNLRYIERILSNWASRRIRTPQDLQNYRSQRQKRFRSYHGHQDHDQHGPKIPIFKI